MKKLVLMIAILSGLTGLHLSTFSETPMWEVPSLLNASRAKEFCSCYFLLKKGHDYCLQRVNNGYPMLGYEVNDQNKFVRFDFLWSSRSARVEKPARLGCKLN